MQRVMYSTPSPSVTLARILSFLFNVLEGLLLIRFILKLLAANASAGFTNLIYSITDPLVAPFVGIVRSTGVQNGIIEWSSVIALVVYGILFWAIMRLLASASGPTTYVDDVEDGRRRW